MKRYALWLLIPFAIATESDCGAPVSVLAWIALGWCAGTIALLERYRRRAEQTRSDDSITCAAKHGRTTMPHEKSRLGTAIPKAAVK